MEEKKECCACASSIGSQNLCIQYRAHVHTRSMYTIHAYTRIRAIAYMLNCRDELMHSLARRSFTKFGYRTRWKHQQQTQQQQQYHSNKHRNGKKQHSFRFFLCVRCFVYAFRHDHLNTKWRCLNQSLSYFFNGNLRLLSKTPDWFSDLSKNGNSDHRF